MKNHEDKTLLGKMFQIVFHISIFFNLIRLQNKNYQIFMLFTLFLFEMSLFHIYYWLIKDEKHHLSNPVSQTNFKNLNYFDLTLKIWLIIKKKHELRRCFLKIQAEKWALLKIKFISISNVYK